MTVFEQIKKLADKQGKSLQRVSEDLGLSQNYIYNLKGAKSPAADKLVLIADYFKVSMDYLMGRSEFTDNDIIIDKTLIYLKEQWQDKSDTLDYPEYINNVSDFDKISVNFAESLMGLQAVFESCNAEQRILLNEWLSLVIRYFLRFSDLGEKDSDKKQAVYQSFNNSFTLLFDFLSMGCIINGETIPVNYNELLGKLNVQVTDLIKSVNIATVDNNNPLV